MSLVYNTNISKTEYLVDLENNGKAKQTALLSMSSTAPSGTFQKGSQYFNSSDKKIYTAVEDNVWGTTGKDPNFGIIYQCNNDYYVWDGDNLITTDLEGYEKLVNKATNFNTLNNTKYPTTKAVADYVVKESIVRNFTDAGITKTTSSDVFSDRTNNTGLAEEILAKQFPTGTTLYGEVRNQGMPTGIGNAEIRVEILETKSNGAQVIEFTLFSVDIEPKEWSHIYFSARTEQQNPWVWVPKAVPTDDYTSNATTTVPTSKALNDGLLLKQDISNKSDDFTEDSSIKYPSSKALSDGLKSVQPNLYDIKLISQAIANKGWAFQGYSTRQDLSKDFVPTVYTDIKMKYDNCDSAPSSSFTTLLNNTVQTGMFAIDDTYIYSTTDRTGSPTYLKRTLLSSFPAVNWENTGIPVGWGGFKPIAVGDKLLIVRGYRAGGGSVNINIYNKSDCSLIKTITTKSSTDNDIIHILTIGEKKVFFLVYQIENNNIVLSKIEDDLSANEVILRDDLSSVIGQPAYDETNNTYWFYYSSNSKICKTTDNFATFIEVTNHGHGYYPQQPPSTFIKGETILVTGTNNGVTAKVSLDSGQTWDYVRMNSSTLPINALPYFDGETMYCQFRYNNKGNIYTSTDLHNFTFFTETPNDGGYSNALVIYTSQKDTLFTNPGQSRNSVDYLGIVKTVYTDTYTIGGSSINVDYYKYGSFKICAKDGGINDANIDTVYNALGYENYFVIDDTNETVALPRNSNLWSFMYVGDDYISENIPNGNYIPFALKPLQITNISASNWVADNTYTDYGYKCDLSCSGVTANMFAQVIFAPTEADSGNYATVAQTGNNIITIYSKVNDTITIPNIVVMGV